MRVYPDSLTAANEFIRLAKKSGHKLTPLQILKLVYIAHGRMLALYEETLISDDIEAWTYGPIIPRLYEEVRLYRGSPIADNLPAPREKLSLRRKSVIAQTYEKYGSLSGVQLSQMTHKEGTPYAGTYKNYRNFGEIIPNDLIQDIYKKSSLRQSGAKRRRLREFLPACYRAFKNLCLH